MIQRIVLFLLLVSFSGAGCSSLMKPGDVNSLKEIEKDRYQIKTDVFNNNTLVLKSGTYIRVSVQNSSTWVKVYARRSEDELLRAERYLLLYMFDEDFKDKMFDRTEFDRRFYEMVKVASGDDPKASKSGTQQKPKTPTKPVIKKK